MRTKAKKSSSKRIYIITGITVAVLIFVGAGLMFLLGIAGDERNKSRVAVVSLLKPPPPMKEKPPPPLKERLPEPEIQKKQEIETVQQPERPAEDPNPKQAEPPAGDQLGLDAAGGAGSDSFGLMGKKGGRALVGSGEGTGGGSGQDASDGKDRRKGIIGGESDPNKLLREFAWYNQVVQEEMRKIVRRHLNQNGGIPKGKLEAVVRIVLDDGGAVVQYRILNSSGNPEMDEALKESLAYARISEPPPQGIPRSMKIKIISQG